MAQDNKVVQLNQFNPKQFSLGRVFGVVFAAIFISSVLLVVVSLAAVVVHFAFNYVTAACS